MAYFIRLRMQRACELLRGPGLSVKETAAMLGYQDQFYFSRTFKLVVGMPPSDYRKSMPSLPLEPRRQMSVA